MPLTPRTGHLRLSAQYPLITSNPLSSEAGASPREERGASWTIVSKTLQLSCYAERVMLSPMAEFEHSLIAERVRAGLAHAKAKGTKLGRPRVRVNARAVARLRFQGYSCSQVCRALKLSRGTAQRAVRAASARVNLGQFRRESSQRMSDAGPGV